MSQKIETIPYWLFDIEVLNVGDKYEAKINMFNMETIKFEFKGVDNFERMAKERIRGWLYRRGYIGRSAIKNT